MPAHVRKKGVSPIRRRGGVRTKGEPRLVAPRQGGNPSKHWGVVWVEQLTGDDGRTVSRSKRISTGASTEDAARAFFTRWLNVRSAPIAAATVADLLDDYVDWKRSEHVRKGRSPRLIKNIESALREVRAHFGPLRPDEVNFAYVQSYTERRRMMAKEAGGEGTVSDRTISIELAYLRSALKRAVKTEAFTGKIPFVELPEGTSKARERVLQKDERARLAVAVADARTPKHMRAFVVIGLKTGQRGQHIRNLRWEHVDFSRGVLWFRRSNPHAAKNKSCEDVLMGPPLAALLHELKESALTPYVIEHVARTKDGSLAKGARVGEAAKPIGSLKRAWASLLKRARIEGLNVHDLRRSFTSAAADEGAELKEIADFMGVDVKTLRRHYAFSAPERHRGLLEKIEGSA